MIVTSSRADAAIEGGYGFNVVVEDVGLGFEYAPKGVFLVAEIWCQDFDSGAGTQFADFGYDVSEVTGAAVLEIVAVD